MTSKTPQRAHLRIQFTGYWLSGTGGARGRHVDAVTHRDRDGLPAMPMSQIKGQLRETAERLAAAGIAGWGDEAVTRLFGARVSGRGELDPTPNAAGALAFQGDARLSAAARAFLCSEAGKVHRPALFRRLASTAIDAHGVAVDKTLRAVEAAVPTPLEGVVDWMELGEPDAGWVRLLNAACAATLAFGKLKSDGFGRALASVEGRP